MSRMRSASSRNFKDEKLGSIAEQLNPLEKARLYASHETPEQMDSESRQLLRASVEDIAREFENDGMYEGKFGISPREVKQLLYDIADQHKRVTFVEVLEAINLLAERKQEYDFLNITSQGDYHSPRSQSDLIEEFELDQLDSEVRSSLGLVDGRSYEEYLAKYIMQTSAMIKGEKVKNNVTGKFEAPDAYFIKEFEINVGLSETPERFRSNLISRLGAYALDNPGKPIVYSEVYEDIVRLLQESFRKEQAKLIGKIGTGLVLFLQEMQDGHPSTSLSAENRQLITNILREMQGKYGYSQDGGIHLLQHLLKKRYSSAA